MAKGKLSNRMVGSEYVAEVCELEEELARSRHERDEARCKLASAADLANSWARESGVEETPGEFGLRNLIDRLWSVTSLWLHAAERELDEAIRTREKAEAELAELRKESERG